MGDLGPGLYTLTSPGGTGLAVVTDDGRLLVQLDDVDTSAPSDRWEDMTQIYRKGTRWSFVKHTRPLPDRMREAAETLGDAETFGRQHLDAGSYDLRLWTTDDLLRLATEFENLDRDRQLASRAITDLLEDILEEHEDGPPARQQAERIAGVLMEHPALSIRPIPPF
ncbi:hypothetical protein [Nocardia terpenica]|uniref:Uncharacterized protein n=1 Tax=Nocardia terpenica TaxID=455432 RepID=A0A164H126_9NOCA|nr:hypothetical protein [Nocardia terpenica]KZM68112.1 hypothetical protein AWN90_09225 [Nocardia terpenica]NQE89030.1 hypothetical protein [Nocardia terpenica]